MSVFGASDYQIEKKMLPFGCIGANSNRGGRWTTGMGNPRTNWLRKNLGVKPKGYQKSEIKFLFTVILFGWEMELI